MTNRATDRRGAPRKTYAVSFTRGNRLDPPIRAAAPDPADPAELRRFLSATPRPWAVDLFAGAGGLSLGLTRAGIAVVAAAELDPAAAATHHANIGGLTWSGDLSDPAPFLGFLHRARITSVDVVAGGPPCQPFSKAGEAKLRSLVESGQRSVDDPRTRLWRSFLTVVDDLSPGAVVFENVPGLVNWDDGTVLTQLIGSLADRGYQVDARIVQASDHGVPQFRARLILVGVRSGAFDWPDPAPPVTLADAISDLPVIGPAQRQPFLPYGGPRTQLQRRLREGVPAAEEQGVFDHVTRDVRPDDAVAFRAMPEGGTYLDVPEALRRYRSDIFEDKYKRLSWDQLSRTITAHIAKDGYWYIHPAQHRTLSIREAARIQTFPDWYRFAGYPSEQLKQIGNAVPPLLGEAVARQVQAALFEHTRPTASAQRRFAAALLRWHRADRRQPRPWRQPPGDPWFTLTGELLFPRALPANAGHLINEVRTLAPHPPAALASAHALRIWAARRRMEKRVEQLLEVAKTVTDRHDGNLPEGDLALRQLPGIGDGVAAAVRCWGWGRSAVPLTAGLARVVGRVSGRPGRARWQLRLECYRLAPPGGPGPEFCAAVCDLADSLCHMNQPDCHRCPVRQECNTGKSVDSGELERMIRELNGQIRLEADVLRRLDLLQERIAVKDSMGMSEPSLKARGLHSGSPWQTEESVSP